MTAVDRGHLHVAEILVKNGADMNYRNKVIEGIDPCNTSMHNVANDKAWYYGEPVGCTRYE